MLSRVEGASVRDLQELMNMDEAHSLLAFNVPAQLVKDIASVRALWRFGGWAIDLDIIAVRQVAEWPVVSGYGFAQQPPRNDRFGKTYAEVSLAIFDNAKAKRSRIRDGYTF